MIFEWSEAKRAANLTKHGVDFEAVRRFDWDTATQALDTRGDYGEHRWRAHGLIAGRLHSLVFTLRGKKIRVISLRKANPKEIAIYEAQSRP